VAVTFCDKVGDFLADTSGTTGVSVGTDSTAKHLVDLLCAGNGIGREHLRDQGVVKEEGRRYKSHHLTIEGDRLLTELLRVTDCKQGNNTMVRRAMD
jgi:hypothetical protein